MNVVALNFWARVSDLMAEKKMTQSDLAKIIGISVPVIRNQIYRGILPRVDTAVLIAQTLDSTAEYLVTGKKPTPPDISNKLDAIKEIILK